jgi:hypothetical protein
VDLFGQFDLAAGHFGRTRQTNTRHLLTKLILILHKKKKRVSSKSQVNVNSDDRLLMNRRHKQDNPE